MAAVALQRSGHEHRRCRAEDVPHPPAERLRDGARYIVGIRDVVDGDGQPLAPSPAFAALRDETELADASVQARRGLYEDIFGRLEEAGVARADLQLAWDFTTASDANNTGWMLDMRDRALEIVGETGPTYEITQVDEDWDPRIAYRIFGTMSVPLFVDQPGPGARLVFDETGRPTVNAEQPEAVFEWEALIPASALEQPAALLQYGHGLLGQKEQIEARTFGKCATSTTTRSSASTSSGSPRTTRFTSRP